MPMPRCAWLIVGMFLSACGSPPKPSLAETEKYPIAPGMHRYMVLPVGGPGVPSGVLRATIFNDSLQRETSVNVVNPWGANRDHPDELTLDHDGIGTFDVPIATHTYRFTIMDVRGQEVWTGPGLMLDERLESQLWYRIMDPKILATYMMDGRALCANAQGPVWWLSRADGRCYAADNPVPDTSIHLKNPEVYSFRVEHGECIASVSYRIIDLNGVIQGLGVPRESVVRWPIASGGSCYTENVRNRNVSQ